MVLIKVKKGDEVIENICCQNVYVNFETNLINFYNGHNWQTAVSHAKEIKLELLDDESSLIIYTVYKE